MSITKAGNRKARQTAAIELTKLARDTIGRLGHRPSIQAVDRIKKNVEATIACTIPPFHTANGLPFEIDGLMHGGDGDGPAAAHGAIAKHAAEPLARLVVEFLGNIFKDGDTVEVSALPATGKRGMSSMCGRIGDPEDRERMTDFITSRNFYENLYYGAHPRKAGADRRGDASTVDCYSAVCFDFDFKPDLHGDFATWRDSLVEQLKSVRADNVRLIGTGGGVQARIQIDHIHDRSEIAEFAGQVAALSRQIGSDDVSDLPRVLRSPFTINVLNDKKRAAGREIAFAGVIQ